MTEPHMPVIDPTKNVLDVVAAESRFQNAMRDAENKRQDNLRVAERRRVNDLESQRIRYDNRIDALQSGYTKTTSDLLAAQLDKTATTLGNLITTGNNLINTRLAALEQFRYEQGGRSKGLGDGWGIVVGVIGIVFAGAALFWKRAP